MVKKKNNVIRKKHKQEYYNNTTYDLEIKTSKIPNSGLGVFLANNALPIEKDCLIGYYEGDWNWDKKNLSEYSYTINKNIYIDILSNNIKPYTCMINDAYDSYYENNIETMLIISNEEAEKITRKNLKNYNPKKLIGLYSIRVINPGDELFFSYGDSYWKSW